MLKGQNPRLESIFCHASQEPDFGALRKARQVRDEGQAGGDRPMIHGGESRYLKARSYEHPFRHPSMRIRVPKYLQLHGYSSALFLDSRMLLSSRRFLRSPPT